MILLTPLPDGKKWKLYEDFHYAGIIVPKGFVTDFTSVPRPLYKILPRWGKYGVASIIHDYLYAVKTISRKESDLVLWKVMDESGVNVVQKYLIYYGARIFGGIVWKFKKYNNEGLA